MRLLRMLVALRSVVPIPGARFVLFVHHLDADFAIGSVEILVCRGVRNDVLRPELFSDLLEVYGKVVEFQGEVCLAARLINEFLDDIVATHLVATSRIRRLVGAYGINRNVVPLRRIEGVLQRQATGSIVPIADEDNQLSALANFTRQLLMSRNVHGVENRRTSAGLDFLDR